MTSEDKHNIKPSNTFDFKLSVLAKLDHAEGQ